MASVNSTKNQEHDLALFPYIGRLDLDQAPFFPNSGSQFFFSDPSIKQSLDLIRHLTQSSNLVPVVLSPKGGGKSSLLQAFIDQADSNSKICTIDADQANDKSHILREISKCFGLDDEAEEQPCLHLLHKEAIALYQNSKYPVIAIENAQYLQDDACKLLLSLQQGIEDRENTWHILFFADSKTGEPPKLYNINLSEYPQLYILLLEPFTLEQTKNYIDHRLVTAGYKGEMPLTAESIKYIHTQSKGLPGKINELSHSALLKLSTNHSGSDFDFDLEAPPATKKRSSPFRSIIIGSLLTFSIIAVLYMQDNINALFHSENKPQNPVDSTSSNTGVSLSENNIKIDSDKKKEQLSVNQVADLPSNTLVIPEKLKSPLQINGKDSVAIVRSDSTPADKSTIEENNNVVITPSISPDRKSSGMSAENPGARSDTQLTLPVKTASIKTQTLLPDNIYDERWLLSQTGQYTVQLLGISDEKILARYLGEKIAGQKLKHEVSYYVTSENGINKHTLVYGIFSTYYQARHAISKLPMPVKSNGPWPVKLDDVKKSILLQQQTRKELFSEPQPAIIKKQSDIMAKGKNGTSSNTQEANAWITKQNPNHFTIQLLSTSTKKSLLDYINRFKLQDHSVLYQRKRQNKDWHVLLYGIFETSSEAKSTVNNMPADIRSNSPWVRKMSDLQKEVRIKNK